MRVDVGDETVLSFDELHIVEGQSDVAGYVGFSISDPSRSFSVGNMRLDSPKCVFLYRRFLVV